MSQIKQAINTGHGLAVLYAGFIGLVLSDIIPTPGDAVYFYQQRLLKERLNKGEITPKQYWIKDAAGYYLYNSAWWALVFGVVLATKGDFNQKLKLSMAMMGGGFVASVLIKNIKKDTEQKALKTA